MKQFQKIRSWVFISCLVLTVAPHLIGKTRKGDKLIKQAQKAEADRDWDVAVNLYDEALATDPQDAGYLLMDQRIHSKAASQYIAEGRELQKAQKLENALVLFQKAYLADPGSQMTLQEIHATTAMLRERAKNPPGTPIYTPAEQARREVERRIDSLEGPPTLRPINDRISSLKMNNQPARMLYESVCKLAGINVLFDPAGLETAGGGTGKNFNLDLDNVTLEEALNYTALTTHTFWKPISRNAIFVTQEGEQKRMEYQDEVVKVFYIQNASTPNEFTEIFNGVRTGAKLTSNVFQVASQNAIIARGTPDTIALVEKLVHDLDKPKAEVVMDIIIMEVNKNKSTTIGAALLGQQGLTAPLNFTPRSGTPVNNNNSNNGTGTVTGTGTTTGTPNTTPGQFTIAQAGHFSSADYSTVFPSTVVQALLSDATTHILQRPQIRATDGGKASLKVGLKVPYVSGSLNSAVATPGSIPYATTQFQQVETGTLIDLEPHVNGLSDISMHIRVEISSVAANIPIAGITEPEIAQQIDEANIRMKDGEVSILGGLSDREKSSSLQGVPGFANIPLLGYIFGTRVKSNLDQEILIAIVPHITRSPDFGGVSDQGVYAGTDRVPRVERRIQAVDASYNQNPKTPAINQTPVAPSVPVLPAPNPAPPVAVPNPPPAVRLPQTGTPPQPNPQ